MIKWDMYICVAILILLIAFASQLPAITWMARIYPMIVSIGILLCVLLLLVKTIKNPVVEGRGCLSNATVRNILLYLLLVLIYILLWDIVGFGISTILFTLVSLHFLGMRSKMALIAFPILLTAVIYVVFEKLILVDLPAGILIEHLW